MDRRSKKWIRYLKLLGCCVLCGFLLAGCTARDLEERRFPMALELSSAGEELVLSCAWAENSQKNNEVEEADQPDITRVTAQTVQEALQKVQSLQDKYVDYSQVKAIVWHDSLPEQSALGKQALAWLEETPELARNILVFLVPDGGEKSATHKQSFPF